jgi:hypothetical protein
MCQGKSSGACGIRSWVGEEKRREEKSLLLLPIFEPRTVQLVTYSLY